MDDDRTPDTWFRKTICSVYYRSQMSAKPETFSFCDGVSSAIVRHFPSALVSKLWSQVSGYIARLMFIYREIIKRTLSAAVSYLEQAEKLYTRSCGL